MTDQTTTPAVHAMQDEWPNGVTPCCGARSADMPEWTRWTTKPAEITCSAVAEHPDLLAAKAQARTETTTPEPEWLTHLRQDMRAAIGSTPIASSLDVIASVATRVAAAHLRPIYAELVNARDEYEGTETRKAELEADVRALGGDPDRMVDPRDHEAAIKAMREDMQPDQSGPHIIDRIAVDRARDIAEEHMLRMAQARLAKAPVEPACICEPEINAVPNQDCPRHGETEVEYLRRYISELEELTKLKAPAPEVREVPAGESREVPGKEIRYGDRVSGVYVEDLPPGTTAGDGSSAYLEIAGDCGYIAGLTVSRPVSPLPDQPGAVIRCEVQDSAWALVAELHDDGRWYATDGRNYRPEDVTEFTVLAGAGMDAGGKP